MSEPATHLLEARGLCKYYGNVVALKEHLGARRRG